MHIFIVKIPLKKKYIVYVQLQTLIYLVKIISQCSLHNTVYILPEFALLLKAIIIVVIFKKTKEND